MVTIFALRKACLSLVLFLTASALCAGHRGASVSINDGRDPSRCEDITITIDGSAAARGQEAIRIPETPGVALRVRVENHSGIRVVGADRRDFEILACKAAASNADLARIKVTRSGEELSVSGPGGDDWAAYILIAAPRHAALDLEAESAPIGLRGLSARVTARTVNGPISLEDCPGEIDAEAENGPIHVSGAGGNLRLKTSNGPIGVSLSGSVWSGGELEASAVNGPVDLVIPSGYRSGAVVESDGHGPFQCRGEVCAQGRRTWDDRHRRFELGEGPALIRVSTRNGPVSVRSARPGDDDAED